MNYQVKNNYYSCFFHIIINKRQCYLFVIKSKYRKGDIMEALIFNDPNFSEETLRIINLYKSLAQWFKKNQFALSYYGFPKPNFDFDNQNHYPLITGILKKWRILV